MLHGQAPSTEVAAVNEGRVFVVSSGVQTLGLAGNVRGLLANPPGSGKTITVTRLGFLANAAVDVQLILNPTTGLPSGPKTPMSNIVGSGQPPVATVNVDTSTTTALGGGTLLDVYLSAPANTYRDIDNLAIVLAPGVSVGFNAPFTAAATMRLDLFFLRSL